MEDDAGFLRQNLGGILVLIVVFAVSFGWFFWSGGSPAMADGSGSPVAKLAPGIFDGMELKVEAEEDQTFGLYALAPSNALARQRAELGNPIPEKTSIVLGWQEAEMMKEEKEFSNIGDWVNDVAGVGANVEGVLARTGTVVDYLHFLSGDQFKEVDGEPGRAFVRIGQGNVPKLFFYLAENETLSIPLKFAQGSFDVYQGHEMAGKGYLPLVIGSKEAKSMQEQSLFKETGDIVRAQFGWDFIVVGILEETNSSIDLMRITPLTSAEVPKPQK